jgi:hypothetical protein
LPKLPECLKLVLSTGLWQYEKDWNAEQHRVQILQGHRTNDFSLQGVDLHDLPYFGLGIIEPGDPVMLDIPQQYTDLLKRFLSEYRIISGCVSNSCNSFVIGLI